MGKMHSGDFFIGLKRAIFWLLQVGLAATSLLFVQETIKDYLERKTEFHQSKLPVTIRDLPTYTLCVETLGTDYIFMGSKLDRLEYGKDISIFHFTMEEKFCNLEDLWRWNLITKPLS